MRRRIFLTIYLFLFSSVCFAQNPNTADLIKEHVYGGLPSSEDVNVRKAYVFAYDPQHKAPRYVAYHLTENYTRTPVRNGCWKSYRDDPSRADEPKGSDYAGVYRDPIRNYAVGHLAPFMICGGDRDGDGLCLDLDRNGVIDDQDEAATVYEINYHTNLTPQHHGAFNGSGGCWYDIEERIRKLLQDKDELWVFAGPIFGPGNYDKIGDGVCVAPMFFQIIIWEEEPDTPSWEAYMMPHHQRAHGDIVEQRVSIRHIEAMTGLDFFPDLGLGDAERMSTYP